MCSSTMQSEFHTPINVNKKDCDSQDDFREVRCKNKNNQRLVEVLKTELECGWGSGASSFFDKKMNDKIIAFSFLGLILLLWI